jgi:hypothetical protein
MHSPREQHFQVVKIILKYVKELFILASTSVHHAISTSRLFQMLIGLVVQQPVDQH